MKKLCFFTALAMVFSFYSCGSVLAQEKPAKKTKGPSAEDFFTYKPVVQGGSSEVKNPEKVKTEDGVVKAASAQDAINAVADNHQKEAVNKKENKDGFSTMVVFPNGVGFVASGVSTYQVFKNNTATRISRRNAYVKAFTRAKVELYKILNGLDSKGTTALEEVVKSEVNPEGNKTDIKETLKDEIEQRIEGMLGGFLTHEVNDDEANTCVTVTLVALPKETSIDRLTANVVEAANMKAGLDMVLEEVKNGLVPPVGGRVISVKNTGEKAFVGFGSAVIIESGVSQVQAKNQLNAQRIAVARADDSIGSILKADKLKWISRISEENSEAMKDFKGSEKDDPLAKPDSKDQKKIDTILGDFKNQVNSNDMYQSVRENRLPPGLMHKVWNSEDNGFALAISVWIPSVSKEAGALGAARSKSLLGDDETDSAKAGGQGKTTGGKKPGEKVVPLPSGKVDND